MRGTVYRTPSPVQGQGSLPRGQPCMCKGPVAGETPSTERACEGGEPEELTKGHELSPQDRPHRSGPEVREVHGVGLGPGWGLRAGPCTCSREAAPCTAQQAVESRGSGWGGGAGNPAGRAGRCPV